ncbi:hypothetical protein BgiBS90_036092, partial [Biomphalaria glabrata]
MNYLHSDEPRRAVKQRSSAPSPKDWKKKDVIKHTATKRGHQIACTHTHTQNSFSQMPTHQRQNVELSRHEEPSLAKTCS